MKKVIDISDRLKNSNKTQNKNSSYKNIDAQNDEITLVPRENRILLEIIEDELLFLDEGIQELKEKQFYIKNDEEAIQIEEFEAYHALFESINKKVKNSFGLGFLPDLTLRELANLAAAVEEKVVSFDFEENIMKRLNQNLKKEIDDLHNKLMFHFVKLANSSNQDMLDKD